MRAGKDRRKDNGPVTEAEYEAAYTKRLLRQPMTFREVGVVLGMGREQVRRVSESAIAKLRVAATARIFATMPQDEPEGEGVPETWVSVTERRGTDRRAVSREGGAGVRVALAERRPNGSE